MSFDFDWNTGPLAQGLQCYRDRQFFDAHEHWETTWLALSEPDKSFLQALIQTAAAFHHLDRGNRAGAVSLLARALRRFDLCPSCYGSVDVASLREQVREFHSALVHDRQLPAGIPRIRVTAR